ncbi:hypothetical protein ACW5EG_02265 [Luteimonas sp. A611]
MLDAAAFPREAGPSAPHGEQDAGAVPAPRLPASRRELVDSLEELRTQGSLDVADEAAILREYDALLEELKVEKARLEAEFRERTGRGQDASCEWLAEAAATLGRRQGERMRRLFQTIPALTQSAAPA